MQEKWEIRERRLREERDEQGYLLGMSVMR